MARPLPSAALVAALCALSPCAWAQARATLLHSSPAEAPSGEPLQVDGSLAPGDEPIKRVVLKYRGPREEWVEAPMELQYGDLYRGVIPAKAMKPPGVEYFVEGTTASGARVLLFMTAARPARVAVGGAEPAEAEPIAERPPEKEKERPPDRTERGKRGGKKGKKGKATVHEEPEPPPPEPAVVEKTEPAPEPVVEKTERKGKIDSAFEAQEPEKEEPVEVARAEPEPPPRRTPPPRQPPEPEARAERPAPDPRSSRARRGSALEEELRVYAAEDPSGLIVRNEKAALQDPRLTQVVTRAQMKALGVRTVMEVLDFLQGITVSRSVQGFYRVAVRGIRAEPEVLFLYDGHRLNDLYDGQALANVPIENLDRIEIVRGPQATRAGTGAVLMTVNLVTNRESGVRASFNGGSYARPPGSPRSPAGFDGHLGAAGRFGGLLLHLDGDVWSHGGYVKPVWKDALDVDTAKQGKRLSTDPAGLTNDQRLLINVGAGLGWESAEVGRLWLSGRFQYEDRAGLVGLFDAVGEDSRLNWQNVLTELGWDKRLGEAARLGARLVFDQRNTRRTWQLTPRDYATAASKNQLFPEGILEQVRVGERTLGAQVHLGFDLPLQNSLEIGAQYELRSLFDYAYLTNYVSMPSTEYSGPDLAVWRDETGAPQSFLIANNGGPGQRHAIGAWLNDTWRPVEPLTIDVGVRFDLTQLPATDSTGAITGMAFVPFVGPRAAISFAATPALALKLAYGRMFRAPTVQELAETLPDSDQSQGRFTGNPALRPSTVDTVEAGLDWMQGFGEARLRLRGSAFFSSIADAIHPTDPSGNIVPYSNRRSGVLVFGADGEARIEAGRLVAFVNGSWFRAQDMSTPTSGYLLTDVPQGRLNAGASLPLGPWLTFDVTLRVGTERRNNQRTTLELLRRYTLPAYGLVGVQLRTEPILDHFELALNVSNVFDLDYEDDAARPDRMKDSTRPDRVRYGVPREGWGAFGTIRGWY